MKHRRCSILLLVMASFLPCCPSFAADKPPTTETDPIEVMRLLAETYVATGEHDKAIELYTKILQRKPADVDARMSIAQILGWKKRYTEAIDIYLGILQEMPDNVQVMKRLARLYTYDRQFDKAEQLYRACIQKDPNDPEAYTLLGEILTWQRHYDEAISNFRIAISKGESRDAELLLGRAILYSGDPATAEKIFLNFLKRSPDDYEAKLYLAESYSYNQQFDQAIVLYRQLLMGKKRPFLEKKLAEVLSWNRQYTESIQIYNKLLKEKYDVALNVQKARVLGWAQEYRKAEKEYKSILARGYNKEIDLEMQGKVAYWDRDWIRSDEKYTELVTIDPENVEAWFDLSQIYSYRMQWQKAIDVYHKILSLEPNHFRSKEGLKKAELISTDISVTPVFHRFKALSPTRSTEINERQSLNGFDIPFNKTNFLHVDCNVTKRHFFAYPNILEHQNVFRMTHLFGPDSWISAYYGAIEYRRGRMHERFIRRATMEAAAAATTTTKGVRFSSKKARKKALEATSTDTETPPAPVVEPVHLRNLRHKYFQYWGAELSHRISDLTSFTLDYNKQRLENNSIVLRKAMFYREYRGRVDFNCMRDLFMGVDFNYSHYSDNNRYTQPGADILYFISRDPKRLYIKYRYYRMNFKHVKVDYWTPQHLSVHCATLGWRQFLNKGEVFFGQNELYYGLKYEPSIDSTQVVEHKYTGEFGWDITKQLNVSATVSILRSSNNVYRENGYSFGLKYYF